MTRTARPLLEHQLGRQQATLTALTCLVLAGATAIAGAALLRRDQDAMLRAVVASTRRAVGSEERTEGLPFDLAARQELLETDLVGHRVEVVDKGGRIVAAAGTLPDSDGAADIEGPIAPGTCASFGGLAPWSGEPAWRACAARLDDAHVIRVVGRDALSEPLARETLLALVIALPVAALAGSLIGGALVRRRLKPLARLHAAVSSLDVTASARLGVDAEPSELADLERAIDALVAELRRALERERRFSQEASHELRTPLTALRARLALARDAMTEGGSRDDVAHCLEDVEALGRLTQSLLLLARSESAALPEEPVNACDVARSVIARQAAVDPPASRPIDLAAPDELLVRGDEDLLVTAVANLVENARRHAGAGARVSLAVRPEGRHVVVTVSDDGPGIPAAQRELVFERFFRGSRERAQAPGAGLGLAVARAIAVRHGGSLTTGPSASGGEEMRLALPMLGAP